MVGRSCVALRVRSCAGLDHMSRASQKGGKKAILEESRKRLLGGVQVEL